MGWVAAAAASLGASEAALRLILGQLSGYPLMLLYRRLLAHRDSNTQHAFFFLSGLVAGQWVVGPEVVHSLYAVLATYLVLLCAAGTLTSVILSFVFNLGYLLVGYLYTESEGYDICWTMPHCVLALKLIGLTFDCYDGARAARLGEAVLSKDQKKTYLLEPPGLLEMLSHSFFIGGYFVGPQIPLRRYRQFVRPSYTAALPSSPLPYALKRLALGMAYMLLHVLGSGLLPSGWPASQAFVDTPLPLRLLLLPLWVKIILAKYLFAWLVAEGVCVLSGLSFVERRPDGSVDWRGCANVKVGRLETATCFANVIEAFNINTNQWVATYVYKRFKFLGNQMVSQMITLVFLAVWHGFHAGYYLTFANEFMTMQTERSFLSVWGRSPRVQSWRSMPGFQRVTSLLGWVWVWVFLPHAFLPFGLLLWGASVTAYSHTYFFMYVVYAVWWLGLRGALRAALGGPAHKERGEGGPVKEEGVLNEPSEKALNSEKIVAPDECKAGETEGLTEERLQSEVEN